MGFFLLSLSLLAAAEALPMIKPFAPFPDIFWSEIRIDFGKFGERETVAHTRSRTSALRVRRGEKGRNSQATDRVELREPRMGYLLGAL